MFHLIDLITPKNSYKWIKKVKMSYVPIRKILNPCRAARKPALGEPCLVGPTVTIVTHVEFGAVAFVGMDSWLADGFAVNVLGVIAKEKNWIEKQIVWTLLIRPSVTILTHVELVAFGFVGMNSWVTFR